MSSDQKKSVEAIASTLGYTGLVRVSSLERRTISSRRGANPGRAGKIIVGEAAEQSTHWLVASGPENHNVRDHSTTVAHLSNREFRAQVRALSMADCHCLMAFFA